MRTAFLVFTVFLSLATQQAGAEPVTVRTAEHEGFTRLVLDLPRPVAWSIVRSGNQHRLKLEGIAAEFDLRDSFRRITRQRVTNIRVEEEDENTLGISVGCDCVLESSLYDRRMLVIDVRPRLSSDPDAVSSDAPGPIARSAAPQPSSKPRPGPYRFPFETSPEHSNQLPIDLRPPVLEASGIEDLTALLPTPEKDNAAEERASDLTKTETARLSAAEKQLAEQLSRAATQGLVTPRTTARFAPLDERKTASETAEATPSPPELVLPEPPSKPGINLRASSSADRDFLSTIGQSPVTSNGGRCFSDEDLAIASWGDETSFDSQIGQLRAALYGEFDRPDKDAAVALARLYLHFGFGAEAKAVISNTGLGGETAAILNAMADIMDDGHAKDVRVFANQFDCDSAASLWAVLAHESLPRSATIEGDAILRSISALPPRLRALLGPIAGGRFIESSREALAARTLQITERGVEKPDTHFEMVDASLDLREGETGSAERKLENVVETNDELSPKALIALIEARLSAAKPIDRKSAELAGAYAREYRGEEIGHELERVHVLALADIGDFSAAFRELDQYLPNALPSQAKPLRSRTMAVLARAASDEEFVKQAIPRAETGFAFLEPDAGAVTAKRLLDLGFPTQADRYLSEVVEGESGDELRLLRARSALEQGRPMRAQAELIGLNGREADLLRARARSKVGDHVAAQDLFTVLGENDRAIEEAWLASDWPRLRATEEPLWNDVAELGEDSVADTAPSENPASPRLGPLARNRILLEDSAAARTTLHALLSRFAVEPLPPS